MIDVIILMIAIGLPLTLIYGEKYWTGDTLYYGVWDGLLNHALPLVATIWFWLKYLGTPGKMLVKIKIVDAKTDNKLSLGQAVGRYFAYILSAWDTSGLVSIKKKQGWHDKLAGTLVVKKQ